MHGSSPAAAELLACFFEQCERGFRFLEEQHKFSYLSGLVEYRKNYKIIKPYQNATAALHGAGNFLAITRYELDDLALEIQFSKSRLSLEGYMYLEQVQRLEFSEILAAARKDDARIARSAGLTDTHLLGVAVSDMARCLKKHKKYFVSPKLKHLERAATIRHTRLEQAVREHFKSQLSDTCIEAARAFTSKDYKRVIDLLQPVEPYLTIADSKKLNLARKHFFSQKS